MKKWDLINELEVEDPEGMTEFSVEDLTWNEIQGDQVAIIPYCRLEDFISGEEMRESAPTQFVAKTRRSKDVKDIKMTNSSTYLEYVLYWCAYGPNHVQARNVTELESTTKKRLPRQSIKVGCQCHFIMRRLALRPNDVVLIYTACRHVDEQNVVCHGNEANDIPKKFNFAPHLTENIRTSVEELIRDGFNATMIWDKFISDVRYGSGELFTGAPRDSFMTRQDVLNIYNNIKRLEYVRHESDPMSVDCWVRECPESFFFYQQQDVVKNIPFIVGIQTKWMLSMMVKHSHNNVISMDSTFSTNKYGYQLYTLMVFDDHRNGIPVAWVISSRNSTPDICKWMSELFANGKKEQPNWHVRAFITDDAAAEIEALRTCTNSTLLLCVWHVRRAWLKNVGNKVKGKENKVRIFRALGEIMHSCKDDESVQQAIESFFADFEEETVFLDYFATNWLANNKLCMWAKAYRNFPHSNQDTNNAIESYHRYLKQRYLREKNNASHRRVDWLLHLLLKKVELYYIHMQSLKNAGFVRAKKTEHQLNESKCKAKNIPDEECVVDGNCKSEYLVRSQTMETRDTWYNVIYKGPTLHFCNCKWAVNGNICKHVLKVEMLVTSNALGGNVMPNVLSDLNETCFPPSPSNLISHNENHIYDVEDLSYHTDSSIIRPNSALTTDDEIKRVISSTHNKLRGLLQITPTTLEQAYALNKLVENVIQEYNKKKFSVVTPSKITTKRRHSFLSPLKKKGQHVSMLKSRKDEPQFLKVGRVRGKKKSMNEQLEKASTKEINPNHTSRRVQQSLLQNFAEGSTSHDTSSCQIRLFDDNIVESNSVDTNMGSTLIPFPFGSPRPPLPLDQQTPSLFPPYAPCSFLGHPTSTLNNSVPHPRVLPPIIQPVELYHRPHPIPSPFMISNMPPFMPPEPLSYYTLPINQLPRDTPSTEEGQSSGMPSNFMEITGEKNH